MNDEDKVRIQVMPFADKVKQPWKDTAATFGCALCLIVLLYATAIGFDTIVHWIFR